jgi:hypothetical protein
MTLLFPNDPALSEIVRVVTGLGNQTSISYRRPVRVIVTPADDMRDHREKIAFRIVALNAYNERLHASRNNLDNKVAKNTATIATLRSKCADFAAAIHTLEGPDALIDFEAPSTTTVDTGADSGTTYVPYTNDGAGA